jgi:hypothetical protein
MNRPFVTRLDWLLYWWRKLRWSPSRSRKRTAPGGPGCEARHVCRYPHCDCPPHAPCDPPMRDGSWIDQSTGSL